MNLTGETCFRNVNNIDPISNRCKINIKYQDREVLILTDLGENRDGAEIVQRGVCDQKIYVGCMKNNKMLRNNKHYS